jgi:hypothetical protein
MAARSLWSGWGEFRRHTVCDECGGHRYCHAARRRGRWLCLDCFDVSADADRFAAELHDRLYGRLLAASGGDSVQAEHVAETVERVRA